MTEAVPSSTAATGQTEEAVVAGVCSGGVQTRATHPVASHQIWEEEGRPDGTELDYWLGAEAEVIAFGEDVWKKAMTML